MSDLQCPATLLVARHGDAGNSHPTVLPDDRGRLTETGREQVRELAVSLAGRRVAAVCTSGMRPAVESGVVAADVLGVATRVVSGLEELSVGEGEREVLERYRGALEEIADLHRGETVLVLSHGGVMAFALPRMGRTARRDLADRHVLPSCAVAEVSIDADDVVVRSWPGSADHPVV